MRKLLIVAAALTAIVSGEVSAATSKYTSTSTITYNGIKYQLSSTSTCADGTAALRLNRKWWCPVTTTTTASTSSGTTTTTTTTSTDTTATSGTTTTSGTTSTGTTTTTTTTTTTPKTYNASVSWTVPSTRADGTPLSVGELSGYEVYYTNDSGSVSASVPVSGGSTASAVVSNLASGNYYFSISAVDSTGLKSALSTVASVTFP